MAESIIPETTNQDQPSTSEWNYHPHPGQPIQNNHLFEWPPNPLALFKWLRKAWLTLSEHMLMVGLSLLTALLQLLLIQA